MKYFCIKMMDMQFYDYIITRINRIFTYLLKVQCKSIFFIVENTIDEDMSFLFST